MTKKTKPSAQHSVWEVCNELRNRFDIYAGVSTDSSSQPLHSNHPEIAAYCLFCLHTYFPQYMRQKPPKKEGNEEKRVCEVHLSPYTPARNVLYVSVNGLSLKKEIPNENGNEHHLCVVSAG